MSTRASRYTTTREERILVVARRMRDGAWQRGDAKALAAEWAVPLHLAEQNVADAAAVLRVARTLFNEEARAELLRRFGEHLKAG